MNEQKILDLLTGIKGEVAGIKGEVTGIKNSMVTKEDFVISQDKVIMRLVNLDIEQKITNAAIKRINDNFDEFRADYESSTDQNVATLLRMEGSIDGLDGRMDGLDGRMYGLEGSINETRENTITILQRLETDQEGLDKRMKKIETKAAGQVA